LHEPLYFRYSYTLSFPQGEGVLERFFINLTMPQLARAGFDGDVFGLVSRDDASWARERWDNAVGELDQARRVWHQGNMLNRLSDLTDLGEPLGCVVSPNNA
jgi:hypothetical protein